MSKTAPHRYVITALAAMSAVLWGVFVFQAAQGPIHSAILALGHALMLTAMLIAYPFLSGWRVSHGHVTQVVACRECHAPRWETEKALGFCLRCGSVKVAKPTSF